MVRSESGFQCDHIQALAILFTRQSTCKAQRLIKWELSQDL